ncbi:hypothetical protein RU95_GL000645 [Enterococcus avium]|nr:hypothetical protein RU95_GL000645 [Enterococcus avium]
MEAAFTLKVYLYYKGLKLLIGICYTLIITLKGEQFWDTQ